MASLLGSWGEAAAAEYLRKKRFTLLAAGYRSRFGEIDLIMEDRKFVLFVEVKLRKSASFAEAREFVDARKQARLAATASMWLSTHETQKQPRFDVIEIYAPDGAQTKHPKINHIENAFEIET